MGFQEFPLTAVAGGSPNLGAHAHTNTHAAVTSSSRPECPFLLMMFKWRNTNARPSYPKLNGDSRAQHNTSNISACLLKRMEMICEG